MTKKIIINPCPYCGGEAELMTKTVNFCNDTVINFYMECPGCKAATNKYNTYFGYLQPNMTIRRLTKKEAIQKTINDWNNEIFSNQTRLLHMSDTERAIWHIEKLLSMAWYGAMIPVDSLEYITGWKLRKIAEEKELLKLNSDVSYDLSSISRILFDDFYVKDIMSQYFKDCYQRT
ncbi:hypothetical protein AALC75_21005 [Lachnospiraceae bacterium 48-42]